MTSAVAFRKQYFAPTSTSQNAQKSVNVMFLFVRQCHRVKGACVCAFLVKMCVFVCVCVIERNDGVEKEREKV